jgi:hypothetical protein
MPQGSTPHVQKGVSLHSTHLSEDCPQRSPRAVSAGIRTHYTSPNRSTHAYFVCLWYLSLIYEAFVCGAGGYHCRGWIEGGGETVRGRRWAAHHLHHRPHRAQTRPCLFVRVGYVNTSHGPPSHHITSHQSGLHPKAQGCDRQNSDMHAPVDLFFLPTHNGPRFLQLFILEHQNGGPQMTVTRGLRA